MSAHSQFEGGRKTVIVMVGLPARGKSFIAQKLRRYMRWLGKNTKVFNVGNYRRKELGANHDFTFFEQNNENAMMLRRKFATQALEDVKIFFENGGDIAIFDATNSLRARRRLVMDFIEKNINPSLGTKVQVIFVESICDDASVIETNLKRKLDSPDYRDIDADVALADFQARLRAYESVYETLTESEDVKYCKIFNVTGKIEVHKIRGFVPSQIVFYLLNLHLEPRSVYLSRHGQSMFNQLEKLGGDSELSMNGQEYARRLGNWIKDTHPRDRPLIIWTSTLKRTMDTAETVRRILVEDSPTRVKAMVSLFALNEINAGLCDGYTYEEVKDKWPHVSKARADDKLRFRYPGGGESYLDLIDRLKPLIIEIERLSYDMVLICHQAVARVIVSYFQDTLPEDCPYLEIPLHQVIKLRSRGHGASRNDFFLGPHATECAHTPMPSERGSGGDISPIIPGPSPTYLTTSPHPSRIIDAEGNLATPQEVSSEEETSNDGVVAAQPSTPGRSTSPATSSDE